MPSALNKLVPNVASNAALKRARVVLVLLGVGGLLLKHQFNSALGPLGQAHLGNVTASFAVFFILAASAPPTRPRAATAVIAAVALAVVQAFELTNGFGIMTNVYDPADLVANTIGVALAVGVDWIIAQWFPSRTQPPA